MILGMRDQWIPEEKIILLARILSFAKFVQRGSSKVGKIEIRVGIAEQPELGKNFESSNWDSQWINRYHRKEAKTKPVNMMTNHMCP